MDKKRTQRIIGVLVVIAFVIVLLPLFFSKSDLPSQTASNTSTSGDNKLSDGNDAIDLNSKLAVNSNMTPIENHSNNGEINDVNAQLTLPQTANNNISPLAPNSENPLKIDPNTSVTSQNPVTAESNASNEETQPVKTAAKSSSSEQTSKLHKRAWVVQMGSFKEKGNARRLADKLRAAGFKAFMHTVKSSHGDRIRVYIGPEGKETAAASTSSKVEDQLKMHGIVVPYKPLEL